jgi:signal transduction histidine kinase
VQAMPSGGDLHISTRREVRDGEVWAQVSIQDSGPGIPPEVKERIFEPFVTSRPTGNGLGLTIVHRVVEGHQGRVELISEADRGTTCVVRLPFRETPS